MCVAGHDARDSTPAGCGAVLGTRAGLAGVMGNANLCRCLRMLFRIRGADFHGRFLMGVSGALGMAARWGGPANPLSGRVMPSG